MVVYCCYNLKCFCHIPLWTWNEASVNEIMYHTASVLFFSVAYYDHQFLRFIELIIYRHRNKISNRFIPAPKFACQTSLSSESSRSSLGFGHVLIGSRRWFDSTLSALLVDYPRDGTYWRGCLRNLGDAISEEIWESNKEIGWKIQEISRFF